MNFQQILFLNAIKPQNSNFTLFFPNNSPSFQQFGVDFSKFFYTEWRNKEIVENSVKNVNKVYSKRHLLLENSKFKIQII